MKNKFCNITAKILMSSVILSSGVVMASEFNADAKTTTTTKVATKKFTPKYSTKTVYKKKYPKSYAKLEKAMINHSGKATLVQSEFKKLSLQKELEELYEITDEISYNNPTKFVDSSGMLPVIKTYKLYSTGEVEFKYNFSKSISTKYTTAVNKKVATVANKIAKPSDSDYKKVKAVHDYVVKTMSYDYSIQKNKEPLTSHLAYGGLILNKGVCDSYAKSVQYLLNYMGVEAGLVIGEAGGVSHGWNYVKIDGKYYYLDATWNDTGKTKSFFLSNTTKLAKTHKWVKKDYTKATSNKYNNKY